MLSLDSLPFIYDAADLYKHEISWPAAFEAMPKDDGTLMHKILKRRIEQARPLRRMPDELKARFENLPGSEPVTINPRSSAP